MDDWIEALRQACEQASQVAVAQRLGYSQTVVSRVLRGTYPGNTAGIERAVRGLIMHQEIACPELGEIPMDVCKEHQGRPFSATNPMRVRMFKACRACPHRISRGGKDNG